MSTQVNPFSLLQQENKTSAEQPTWKPLTPSRREEIDAELEGLSRKIQFASNVAEPVDRRVGKHVECQALTPERRQEINAALEEIHGPDQNEPEFAERLAAKEDLSEKDRPDTRVFQPAALIDWYQKTYNYSYEQAVFLYNKYVTDREARLPAAKKYDEAASAAFQKEINQIIATHRFEVIHTKQPPTKKKSALKKPKVFDAREESEQKAHVAEFTTTTTSSSAQQTQQVQQQQHQSDELNFVISTAKKALENNDTAPPAEKQQNELSQQTDKSNDQANEGHTEVQAQQVQSEGVDLRAEKPKARRFKSALPYVLLGLVLTIGIVTVGVLHMKQQIDLMDLVRGVRKVLG